MIIISKVIDINVNEKYGSRTSKNMWCWPKNWYAYVYYIGTDVYKLLTQVHEKLLLVEHDTNRYTDDSVQLHILHLAIAQLAE